MTCIFCEVIEGKRPAMNVYEDDDVLAFLDIMPVNKGHTLVVPKKHFINLYDLPEDELAKVMTAVKKIALAVKKGVQADGINIGMNNGLAAGQMIFHAHLHVIPRFKDDGLRHWPQKTYTGTEIQEYKDKIHHAFG